MMENIFVDINIIIDLLVKRGLIYKDAQVLFTLSDKKEIQLCISSLSFANAYYSIVKQHKDIDTKNYFVFSRCCIVVCNKKSISSCKR